ncbi:hypothetical protein BDY19DRAFT_958185 [Irpex rosettiformis]|uniref:Uncharacterized protein n=1 Tax=Irpex rosettiformis TaxID=378272 RepID=A0ACB8TY86_9APHY|nr:hypothetical protein BDY19DRAFT_958185 [Irpex rosettiformis]
MSDEDEESLQVLRACLDLLINDVPSKGIVATLLDVECGALPQKLHDDRSCAQDRLPCSVISFSLYMPICSQSFSRPGGDGCSGRSTSLSRRWPFAATHHSCYPRLPIACYPYASLKFPLSLVHSSFVWTDSRLPRLTPSFPSKCLSIMLSFKLPAVTKVSLRSVDPYSVLDLRDYTT